MLVSDKSGGWDFAVFLSPGKSQVDYGVVWLVLWRDSTKYGQDDRFGEEVEKKIVENIMHG